MGSTARAAVAALLLGVVVVGLASWRSAPRPLAERVKVGAYVHLLGEPARDPVAPEHLTQLEAQIGGQLDLVHYFFDWGRPFTQALSENVSGRELLLTLKPGTRIPEIASGGQDRYLDEFARQARAWGGPVYLRVGHEMNGEWMEYSSGHPAGPSAAEFRAAWVRIVSRFRAQSADNVSFVWSVNEQDVPNRPGNRMEDYWPGDRWVDIASFDAYNWSNQEPRRGDGQWRSFEQIVAAPYTRISTLTDKEIWLTEFGTTEAGPTDPPGASKAQWFRDMFSSTQFPALTAVVYFSENDQRDAQRDWRLDSSPDSLAGFRDGWRRRVTQT